MADNAVLLLVPSIAAEYQDFLVGIVDDAAKADYGKLILDGSGGNARVSFVTRMDTERY